MSNRSTPRTARGRLTPLLAVLALLALSAFVLAACGSDDSSSDSSSTAASTTSASDAGQKEVVALADQLSSRPTKIPVSTPVGKPIPTGKKIIWVNCGAPVCTILGENFAEGAKELGWSTKILNTDGTPASVQKAWKQALVAKPDGIASSGSDPGVLGAQFKAAKAAGIPIVNYAVPGPVDGMTLNTADDANIAKTFAEPEAAWVCKDSGGKANVLYTTVSAFAILPAQTDLFKKTFEKGCPNGKLTVLDLPVTSLGKDAAKRIVSKLRSDPSTDYVVNALDDVTIGLPAALKAAGLQDKVKLIGGSSSNTNFQYIATGQQAAGVPNDIPGLTWQMVDGMARIFTGQPTDVDTVPQARYIVTKDNVPPSTGTFPFVEDYKEQYKALWGKN